MSNEHKLYLHSLQRRIRLVRIARYALLLGLILLWEMGARAGWMDAFITSSPSRVAKTIANLYHAGDLFVHIGTTLYETVAGFLLGVALGTLVAILLWWSPTLARILDPYLVVLNALPKIALGPILIVWIGAGMQSVIMMGLLISLVVTILTVLAGFQEITEEKQMLMRTLGANKLQILTIVVLPASVPTLMSAVKIGMSMSWVGVIVGEYLVSKSGLGYLIVYGGQVFKLDLVMASVIILCVLAALMYYGLAYLERRLIQWRAHG